MGAYAAEADVYQAYYQLTKNLGVSEDNIIVFGMNSTAFHPKNIHPGEVFEYKGGPNVYPWVKFDYVGEDNNPDVFLSVLSGQEVDVGSKRTLRTTNEDNVVIISIQHGDVGYVCFYYEDKSRKLMFAEDIVNTLEEMKEKRRFSKLFWFMDSCYSGSNFNKVFRDYQDMFFMTAATPERSGFFCDLDADMQIPTNGCLNKRLLQFLRESLSGDVNKTSVYDLFTYSLTNRITTPRMIEENCLYGDLEKTKRITLASIFTGDASSSPHNNSNNRADDEGVLQRTRRKGTRIYENPTSMKNLIQQRGIDSTSPFNSQNPRRSAAPRVPRPRSLSIITLFDADYELCYVYPELNRTCIKQLIPGLIALDPTEECIWDNFDFIRLGCTLGSGMGASTVYDFVSPYCT